MLLAPLGHALQQLVGLVNNQVRALPGKDKHEGNQKKFRAVAPTGLALRRSAAVAATQRRRGCSEGAKRTICRAR